MAFSLEGHTARAFDGELSALHIQAVAMGALVIEQVQLAVNAYSNWDRATATLVLDRERRINSYDSEIEEAALQVIAKRQPVAQDLRAVFAIDKVVTELERAADEAKKLALTVLADSETNGFKPGAATVREARSLGRLAVVMIRAALEAFDRLDPVAAANVIQQDQEMDSEYAVALRRILTHAMEDPRRLQAAIEAAFIMRSLERIGDHARNIARHIGFVAGEVDPNATGVLPASFSIKS
ncbi:MAG TPA: phosphate signaling complex protein PhoU [Steroidobacteraceae bacterium]|nr:phosphate signaling complex protein PhoU [Steroidobacteraceae bacterium]